MQCFSAHLKIQACTGIESLLCRQYTGHRSGTAPSRTRRRESHTLHLTMEENIRGTSGTMTLRSLHIDTQHTRISECGKTAFYLCVVTLMLAVHLWSRACRCRCILLPPPRTCPYFDRGSRSTRGKPAGSANQIYRLVAQTLRGEQYLDLRHVSVIYWFKWITNQSIIYTKPATSWIWMVNM